MNKFKYLQKDITTIKEGIIGHGVNCQRAMGSGVAAAIKAKWPIVYERYMDYSLEKKKALGTADLVEIEEGKLYIVNMYTQEYYGSDGVYASAAAIASALAPMCIWAEMTGLPIYIPKIGAGLGGLDWEKDVVPVLNNYARVSPQIDFYVCVIEE